MRFCRCTHIIYIQIHVFVFSSLFTSSNFHLFYTRTWSSTDLCSFYLLIPDLRWSVDSSVCALTQSVKTMEIFWIVCHMKQNISVISWLNHQNDPVLIMINGCSLKKIWGEDVCNIFTCVILFTDVQNVRLGPEVCHGPVASDTWRPAGRRRCSAGFRSCVCALLLTYQTLRIMWVTERLVSVVRCSAAVLPSEIQQKSCCSSKLFVPGTKVLHLVMQYMYTCN